MPNTMVQGYRLTPQQKRAWLLQQSDDALSQSAQCAILIEGPLHAATLRSAVDMTIMRHEILRTSFSRLPEMKLPLQVVNEECEYEWLETLDLSGLDAATQDARIETELTMFRESCAGSAKLQGQLLNLRPDRTLMLLSVSVLCADAVALQKLVEEIGRCYAATLNDEELSNGHVQYADLSEVLNELLDAEDTEVGRDFWRRQQLTTLESLRLPVETTNGGPSGRFQPHVRHSSIDADTVNALSAIASEHDTNLSGLLLTCWQVLIARLSGQTRIVVGTAYDGRTFEGLGESIGLLTKYLPFSFEVDPRLRFCDLLPAVKEQARLLFEMQDYFSWDHVVAPAGNGANPQFCSYCFDYEEQAVKYSIAQIKISIDRKYVYNDRFKLKLSCSSTPDGLELSWHYDPRYYNSEVLAELAAQYGTLVENVAQKPESLVHTLNVLPEAQRHRVLEEFNLTTVEYPASESLAQLFEEQVERTPLAIAVICGEDSLSYSQLNSRANQLTRELIDLGVGPEVRVGLLMERTLEMIVGLLAILKAGGAYVPLSPDYPQERLLGMVADSELTVLVTMRNLLGRMPDTSARMIYLDEWDWSSSPSTANPSVPLNADNLAYVIYTSGSTGRPKGVMVSNRSVVNRVRWAQSVYPLTPADRVLQSASLSFDFAVWECFGPLLAGAQLVLLPTASADSHALINTIRKQEITVVHFVPSLLQVIVNELEHCPSLRLVLSGGEALSVDLEDRFFSCSKAQLYNQYGPTEACIDASYWRCRSGSQGHGVPIGKPIANTQLYILDEQLEPAPIGTAGDLYIGGIGLARGYLNRADLTAERFVPNPFGKEPGSRLYRTGDLARFLPTGDVEYLGRTDAQVKLRGFRIELGEIEALLTEHASVREAVVVAREEQRGEKRLVAYVVPHGEMSEVSGRELREHLQFRLPQFMVPATVVLLKELPVTASGKLDRKALPAPEDLVDESCVDPRTTIEELVCGIWSEVLGLERVGVEWNFFELGGHSLLATQVVSRVREAFGVELAVRSMFETPTVAGLAELIEALLRDAQVVSAPPIVRVSQTEGAPLSFAQQRLWFVDQLQPGSAIYNLPIAVRLVGELNVKALERTLSELIKRHEVLRTTFTSAVGDPVQLVGEAGPVELPLIDLGKLAESDRAAEAERLAAEEAQRPFDLSRGPLLRTSLLRLGEREHVVLMTMHHIVSDGWSMGVLVREVGVLYEAYSRGQESPLAELPVQYADYATWQRHWLQGEVLEQQLGYWRVQLAGAPAMLELPTDHARVPDRAPRGASHKFTLSAELLHSMTQLARQENVTLFMILLSGLQVLLHCHTGQEDIVVGSNIANRNRKETEDLIGFFVNLLALRTKLSGDHSFRDLLRQVRVATLEAYAHQDVPFEKLIEELQPERASSRTPLVQVVCNFGVSTQGGLSLSGLQLSTVLPDTPSAKFDLTLDLRTASDGIYGAWLYDQSLFEAARIERMTRHFQEVLEQAVRRPEIRVGDFDEIISQSDRRQQIIEQEQFKEMRRRKLKEMKMTFQHA